MRVLTCISAILIVFNGAFGQGTKITLKVVDEKTEKGIKNAHVIILGKPNGATTNVFGFCELTLSDLRELIISHVSYETGKVTVPQGAPSMTAG